MKTIFSQPIEARTKNPGKGHVAYTSRDQLRLPQHLWNIDIGISRTGLIYWFNTSSTFNYPRNSRHGSAVMPSANGNSDKITYQSAAHVESVRGKNRAVPSCEIRHIDVMFHSRQKKVNTHLCKYAVVGRLR